MGTKKKQGILAAITSILLVAVVVLGVVVNDAESKFITIEDLLTPLAGGPVLVQETDADINVIPDKYNTGCKGELTKITEATTINGLFIRGSGGCFVIDFAYANKDAIGDYVIENVDFSENTLSFNNEGKVSGKKVSVTFNNCKFGRVKSGLQKSDVFSYTFNDCTLWGFGGSNATFNGCQFGHSYYDGINPYANVHVNGCYFSDFASTEPVGNGVHSDGTQIYGHSDVIAKDIFFDRCRFEIPAIQTTGDTPKINACITVMLEYNDADNIHVTNCLANGGGYTIYALSKHGDNLLTNISLENIKVGYSKLFGTFYPTIDENVSINNVVDQSTLYVSSVWKDEQGTHIIVSNDTGIERTLKVVTASKEYTYSIKACLGGNDLRYNNFDMSFSEFPFDMDLVVPEDASYIICYDTTNGTESQIRFVNWSGEQVYVGGVIKNDTPEEENKPNKKNKNDKKTSRNDAKKPVLTTGSEVEDTTPTEVEEVVVDEVASFSGACGSSVSFVLTSDGVLTISGSGAMSNFDSSKLAPWNDKMGDIKKVVIEEGVTTVGSQSFKKAKALSEVSLPDSLIEIKGNAFQGCSKLSHIMIGSNVTSIGKYAFSGTALSSAVYQGTEAEWQEVVVGDYNEQLTGCISFAVREEVKEEQSLELIEGSCGQSASFVLSSEGILTISGNGDMKNYDSSKPTPWNDYMSDIKEVVIEEGITSIGSQSFKKAINLCSVTIPVSVSSIKNNAFQGCSSLTEIAISKNVTSIGKYAFSSTGLNSAVYLGSSTDFSEVVVGDYNEQLTNSLVFSE